METYPTLEQITAAVRRVVREEMSRPRKPLADEWVNETDALTLSGKSRRSMLRAIEDGRIRADDIRPNPFGIGYLFRRTALVADKPAK